jgi:phospholipase/carboxylesterase
MAATRATEAVIMLNPDAQYGEGRDCHSPTATHYHAGMDNRPIEIETGPNPQASMIVLHGLGASGDDFVPVCEQLELAAVGPLRHVLPHAPLRPVTINAGYVMPAWYDILALGGPAVEDEAGLRASQALVEGLIAREVSRGVSPSRIVLAGFSQGCAMALLTGLRHAERLAGIVGMSGYLPLADKTAAERTAANQGTPIFLAHGRFDPMIELRRAVATRDALRTLGYDVQWHQYPMEHSVCLPEIADLQRFLLQVLAR